MAHRASRKAMMESMDKEARDALTWLDGLDVGIPLRGFRASSRNIVDPYTRLASSVLLAGLLRCRSFSSLRAHISHDTSNNQEYAPQIRHNDCDDPSTASQKTQKSFPTRIVQEPFWIREV